VFRTLKRVDLFFGGRATERGYAMIAAIVSVAAFGYVSFELLAQNRGVLAEVRGESERAQLEAACDAGLYEALAWLANDDVNLRWNIDGRSRVVNFNGVALNITVEDERGKIPLNGIIEEEARQLFVDAGATPDQVNILSDSFEDWEDVDNTPRQNGAEAPQYAQYGYKPRNAGFRSVSELRMVRGMTDDLFARIAPVVTVFFGESGGFAENTAQPLALEVLGELPPNAPDVLARQRQIAGLDPVPQTLAKVNLTGRTLTVRVEARKGGAYMKRSAIVEMTGGSDQPFWLRYLD
jgi:general secretion pathway protein K